MTVPVLLTTGALATLILVLSSPETWETFSDWNITLKQLQSIERFSKENSEANGDGKVYSALQNNEFRLLLLEPGEDDEPLRCRLIHCSHSEELSYEALSYVWGDLSNVKMVSCNGQSVGVTVNLHNALLHLRQPHSPRILWIDALCINQNDIAERGHQVQSMKRIFAQAQKVLIWLGDDSGILSRCLQALREPRPWYKFHGIMLRMFGIYPHPMFTKSAHRPLGNGATYFVGWEDIYLGFDFRYQFRQDLSFTNSQLADVSEFLEQPWFTRLWVIQELACAKKATIVCGRVTTDWILLADIITVLFNSGIVLQHLSKKAVSGAEAIVEMNRARKRKLRNNQLGMLCVLLATNSAQCSDPRDKVYGVLSLAGDYDPSNDPTAFMPEYDIDTSEVFKRTARRHLEKGNLNILGCTARAQGAIDAEELPNLPSWVPDWTRIDNPKPFVRYASNLPFRSSTVKMSGRHIDEILGDSDEKWDLIPTFSDDGNTMTLRGLIIDKVEELGTLVPSEEMVGLVNHKQKSSMQIDWIEECENLARKIGKDSVWKILTVGLTGDGHVHPKEFSTWFEEYKNFLRYSITAGHPVTITARSQLIKPSADIKAAPKYTENVAAIEASIFMWSSHRRFGVTAEGRLSLLPNGAQQGDIIAVLPHCDVPIVLRPLSQDGEYTMVGEAFLDQYMYGRHYKLMEGVTHEEMKSRVGYRLGLVRGSFGDEFTIR